MRPHHDLKPSDAGISLVEVVVAMVVFAVVATGIIGGVTTITKMTADNRWREVATNVAGQDLDQVRLVGDPFAVSAANYTKTISGRTFTVTRSAAWASSSASAGCGTATKVLYRRVNVSVTWTGQLVTTSPVRTDMILAPNAPISDPSTGTIVISVGGVPGGIRDGISVTVQAAGNGAVAPSTTPPATDADGCSVLQKVAPGTYTVTLARSGFRTPTDPSPGSPLDQASAATKTVSVVAGQVAPVTFQYDNGTNFAVTYAANYSTSSPAIPTNLVTTLVDANGTYLTSGPVSALTLYPYPGGYRPIAGKSADSTGTSVCRSADPAQWPSGTSNGKSLAPAPTSSVAGPPGGSATLAVPMGVVLVTSTGPGYVTAVPATSTYADDPGCSAGRTYTFDNVAVNGSVAIALPYGSWSIYTGASAGAQDSKVTASNLTAPTNPATGGAPTGVSSSTGVVTLDPRMVVP